MRCGVHHLQQQLHQAGRGVRGPQRGRKVQRHKPAAFPNLYRENDDWHLPAGEQGFGFGAVEQPAARVARPGGQDCYLLAPA